MHRPHIFTAIGKQTMREPDDDERSIAEMLDRGVSDADLATMLHDLADVLRGRGGHIGARVAEMAAERLTEVRRPG